MTQESPQAQFIRLGYATGAPRFLARCHDARTFRQCARAAGDHGRFNAENTAKILGSLFTEFRCMDIGHETSPVIYVSLALTRQHRDPAALDRPLEPREILHQRRLITDAARKLHAAPARELHDASGQVTRVRLHWD